MSVVQPAHPLGEGAAHPHDESDRQEGEQGNRNYNEYAQNEGDNRGYFFSVFHKEGPYAEPHGAEPGKPCGQNYSEFPVEKDEVDEPYTDHE